MCLFRQSSRLPSAVVCVLRWSSFCLLWLAVDRLNDCILLMCTWCHQNSHTHISMGTAFYIQTITRTHTHTCIHTHTDTCTLTHTHIQTFRHTHIHTHTHSRRAAHPSTALYNILTHRHTHIHMCKRTLSAVQTAHALITYAWRSPSIVDVTDELNSLHTKCPQAGEVFINRCRCSLLTLS